MHPSFGPRRAGVERAAALTPADINLLVDYMLSRVVGKGGITRAECGVYYGNPNHPRCAQYR